MNTKCIAFWNRISVAAAIAQFLYRTKPVLTARVHTQTKEIPTHKRRLHHWHVAKIDIQNRVNVTVLH